ncbi:MAG: carboxymuconolactone decarboxylase family protein [Phycisphaeraceae bacterium]|nr:MAG: carboxymuconolactone decarboxylase family protein [Phycisphaeraceae bacterium]
MTAAREFYETWPKKMGAMKRQMPEVGAAFHALHQPLMAEGAIDEKTKELIALGISIAIRCEACIYAHIQRAMKLGATRPEILDAAGVAVVMQGGPGYVYVPKVIEALDALEESRQAAATPG